jgi:hypothetical protein
MLKPKTKVEILDLTSKVTCALGEICGAGYGIPWGANYTWGCHHCSDKYQESVNKVTISKLHYIKGERYGKWCCFMTRERCACYEVVSIVV